MRLDEEELRAIILASFALKHFRLDILLEEERDGTEILSEEDGEPEEEGEDERAPKRKKKAARVHGLSRKVRQEEDSDETLNLLLRCNPPEIPPAELFFDGEDMVGECSKPFWKQLTVSDLDGGLCRLTFQKEYVVKALIPLLEDSERPGANKATQVTVFGKDGAAHQMMLKMWAGNKMMYVLSSGWKEFHTHYKFREHCDFVIGWMFRHKQTRKICFAITSRRFHAQKPLSSRIRKSVFKY
ncbi:PREDICTED: putative B3 domain-containing protein At4g03170 [Tarenaya hassleriana]|uniref:putative B3 domain-containing protein At4g03170 n=1 Tax=Tarenaya hassleriana TaxID=28532 RepID=UPI00053C839F|nr:PREDICTED: putative B3 domain-containing protein At4g03170 [Tarenaya hassleriana]